MARWLLVGFVGLVALIAFTARAQTLEPERAPLVSSTVLAFVRRVSRALCRCITSDMALAGFQNRAQ